MNSPKSTTNQEFMELHGQIGGPFRAVIFDFDGTLSLLRQNWQDVMIPMMIEILQNTGTDESPDQLHDCVEEFVMRLNGRQTIYQMIHLANEVELRGCQPLAPLDYKRQYHDLLAAQVERRIAAAQESDAAKEQMTVPGSRALLQAFADAGVQLYLASGTDLVYVREEVALLGLDGFFGEHIYGALDDHENFSKAMIIQQIIEVAGIPGSQILGLGDGFVEIEEVKRVGGTAIGVASNEETRTGINAWKRKRLLDAGADIIIGDYRHRHELLAAIAGKVDN
jgi:phosphoglycolate phosphatase